jgi:hypothetical protein
VANLKKKKKEQEQEYWQTKCWGDQIYDDESLICDKIREEGCCFLQKKKKEEEEEEMREGERGGLSDRS